MATKPDDTFKKMLELEMMGDSQVPVTPLEQTKILPQESLVDSDEFLKNKQNKPAVNPAEAIKKYEAKPIEPTIASNQAERSAHKTSASEGISAEDVGRIRKEQASSKALQQKIEKRAEIQAAQAAREQANIAKKQAQQALASGRRKSSEAFKEVVSDPKYYKPSGSSVKGGVKGVISGFKPTVGGILKTALAAGLGAAASKSRAAETIQRGLEEGDPLSLVFPGDVGAPDKEMIEERQRLDEEKKRQREEYLKSQPIVSRERQLYEAQEKLKQLPYNPAQNLLNPNQELVNTVKPMIQETGGSPDINPKQANKMLGEQPSPDASNPQGDLSVENYNKMMQRKLGYR